MDALEREVSILEKELKEGIIDPNEYNQRMTELECDYRHIARESAQQAHDEEMERW